MLQDTPRSRPHIQTGLCGSVGGTAMSTGTRKARKGKQKGWLQLYSLQTA